ncbi:cartilage intermediate layer protein 1-like [Branchiostoma floridae x Branchiostoma japonicum]
MRRYKIVTRGCHVQLTAAGQLGQAGQTVMLPAEEGSSPEQGDAPIRHRLAEGPLAPVARHNPDPAAPGNALVVVRAYTDCSRVCTVGTLNAACDACTCDDHVLYGHVTDTRNVPLEGCEISFAEKPWEVATTTNSTGRFVLWGACAQGARILVRRAGYFDETVDTTQVDSTTSSARVRLRALDPPIIDENPVGKVRLVGQDVTFCCRAHGTPMPSYYEWFKDGRLLDQNINQYNDTLTLYNVQVSDTGTYKCRANSEAGAKYSSGASLIVNATGSTLCDTTPTTKLIDLPDDCVQPGNTTKYDIGACSRQKCAGDLGEEDKACLDTKRFCCMSVVSVTRTVQCSDYSLEVTVTTECGCGECVELTKRISGRAFGIKNGTVIPLEYGDIIMDGQDQGLTSDTGEFQLTVPLTVDKVTITFKDFYKKLVTTTKVLPIEEGIETYYTVRMQVRPPMSTLNASETSTINLGTLPGHPPLAEVDIPPNSFFTESGDPYTGTVQASVGFIDPRNPDDFDDIQSDLTTVDEEGTQQALRTYGMFSMDFEDDSGNPIVVGGKMTIHIDPAQINIDPNDVDENGNLNAKLWSLNPSSGEWELVGYEPYSFPPYKFITTEYNKPITETSWYNREDRDKKVCFIKVKVSFTNQNSKVEIRTRSEGGGQYPPNSGKVYGIRDDQTQTERKVTGVIVPDQLTMQMETISQTTLG